MMIGQRNRKRDMEDSTKAWCAHFHYYGKNDVIILANTIIMVMVMIILLKLYPPVWNQVVKEILKSRDMKILVGRFSTPSLS